MAKRKSKKNNNFVPENKIDETLDERIEQMEANGGISEAAMEAEIAAQENPKPDYLVENGNPHWFDEEEDYDVGQIPLEVVDRTEMLYANSDKVAAREYKIRIDEGLFKELAPEQYSETSFSDDEIPAIAYRQSTDSEVPDQFLISKFKRGNYDIPLIQTTVEIKDEELLKQIKFNVENYEFDEYIHSPEFIEKFGDWEKANRLEKLKKAEPLIGSETITINGVDVSDLVERLRNNYSKKNLKQLQKIAEDIGKEKINSLRNEKQLDDFEHLKIVNKDSGKSFRLKTDVVYEISEHNIFQKGHIEALQSLDKLIENSIFIGSEKNEDNRKPELKEFFYFASGLKIDNEDYTAKSVFVMTESGELFYDQSLSSIEKGRFLDIIQEKNRLETSSPQKKPRDSSEPVLESVNLVNHKDNPNEYYDMRLIRICQVPQMQYLEKNPVTGKWQPTQEAVELVKSNKLHIEKNKQKYSMIDLTKNNAVKENSNLEQSSLDNAAELLKNVKFSPENYKKLLNVINEISEISGEKKIEVPKPEEIAKEENEKQKSNDQAQDRDSDEGGVIAKPQEPQRPMDGGGAAFEEEKPKPETAMFDPTAPIVYGKTVLPSFAVKTEQGLVSIENPIVTGFNKKNGTYEVESGGEKLELPKKTFETLLSDKKEREAVQARIAEGKTIVFADESRGIKGTEIPEFSLITQHGLKTYKGFVPQSRDEAAETYTLSNGEETLVLKNKDFAEVTAAERWENKFDEHSPAWQKLVPSQYEDYFKLRDNTAANFTHNLSVACREKANSPCDAMRAAKMIIDQMSKDEKAKTQALLNEMAREEKNLNMVIAGIYHEAVKCVPLNEEKIKQDFPDKYIARPMFDTISGDGQKVENDQALVKNGRDRNLRIGTVLKNIDVQSDALFGKGKNSVVFSELRVVSASKEGNSITLMDEKNSYIKLPRDTVLSLYKEQQLREMKSERKVERKNTMSISYS
jgi:hypothetical protein